MNLEIDGKRTLVTGSTAGIGLATARLFAAENAAVVVNGRTEARVAAAVRAIQDAVPGANVGGVAADLGTAAGCAALVEQAREMDILVNNVGIFELKPFEQITDADWLRFFETNVMSGIRLARHYLPGMRARNWGRIIFVSSESGIQIPPEMIHYGMTKAAQIAVARGLAEATAGTGITINSILPGPTRSEGVGAFVEQMAAARGVSPEALEREFFATARPSSLLKRFATVDEVAVMAVYLASPLASATNGAPVRVDGGVVRAAF
ncbi:MAG TPA: SDR family oxidoreductase [Gemmatimonadales bacterium]|nr:SDR family oxidoreductase [Gemmatimonadales bacterium]